MRLSFLEMAGFRGVRAHLRINMPEGFLVVTGRNGSGKSTLCDAVEYALTGAVSKYEEGKESGESTDEYIWWRGHRPASDHFVSVGVRDDAGREFVVRRTPGGVEVTAGGDLTSVAEALCDVSAMPSDPLAQLCRTAIIRDETVAAMSIDQTEADRFKFVQTALGTAALDDVAQRGKAILALLKKDVQGAETAYNRAREDVTAKIAELSRARAEVIDAPDVGTAENAIRRLLGDEVLEPSRLLVAARQRIAAGRRSTDALLRILGEIEAVQAEIDADASADAAAANQALQTRRDARSTELDAAVGELLGLQALATREGDAAPQRSKLATLHEVGRAVGRRHDACPLCATGMPEAQFVAALDALSRELAEADREAATLRSQLRDAAQRVDALRTELADVDAQLGKVARARDERTRRLDLLAEQAKTYGAAINGRLDVPAVLAHIRQAQADLEALGASVSVLEASASLDRVAELERQLAQAQQASDELETRLKELEAAEARAKRLLTGVRRAVGEIVEERLAALDPLLKDLYARLRPHADWTELSYRVRGDVRKFLSLRVGDEVNPRFTFSSGQRRAIGLAFLLAVHLSRPWCRFRSLILDDPIQHIDDFRSLHLVEVLGAIRKAGQQIMCAVEDEDLADLMCRRIRSGPSGEGLLVRMAYRAGDGANIESSSVVQAAVRQLVIPS